MRVSKNNKGISLIALCITIFVIIVFAGIAIASVSSERGKVKNNSQTNTIGKNVKYEMEALDELQLIVVKAIGDEGYSLEDAEKYINENKENVRNFEINKEEKTISGIYKGKSFKINKYGKVESVKKDN